VLTNLHATHFPEGFIGLIKSDTICHNAKGMITYHLYFVWGSANCQMMMMMIKSQVLESISSDYRHMHELHLDVCIMTVHILHHH